MTDALIIKKFADEYIDEFHWDGESLIVFVYAWNIVELCSLLGSTYLSDNGVKCVLKDRYVAIPDFEYILEYFGLDEDDINEIFPKDIPQIKCF